MSPIIPSRYGHPKYNIFPQKSRATSLGGIKGQSQRGTPGSDSKSRRKRAAEENKILIQPTEEEEGDNFYSKHLAAARFQRNHRLINILFSEVVVEQDQGSDNEKLHALRAKRMRLEEFKDKISKEMVELEEKFTAKKAKIFDDGKKFSEKLNEFVNNSKKELETLKAARDVRRQKELLLRQQQARQPANELNIHNGTTSEIKTNSNLILNGITPIETPFRADFNEKEEVKRILNDLVESIGSEVR